MNAELTKIARRFVACPGWVFLPGMLCYGRLHTSALKTVEVTAPMRIASVTDDGVFVETSIFARGGRVVRTLALFEPNIPDLDDPVTAAGILPVVRLAWNDSLMFVAYDADSMDYAEVQPFGVWLPRIPGPLPIAVGPSEPLALLAALEAAPK